MLIAMVSFTNMFLGTIDTQLNTSIGSAGTYIDIGVL